MLRRALTHHRSSSSGLLFLLRRVSSIDQPFFPVHSYPDANSVSSRSLPFSPLPDFIRSSRRSFAKARKSFDDDYDDAGQVAEDIGPSMKSTAVSQMEAAIDALSRELAKLRTGRASPGMLDHIIVETGGIKMSLNHVAVVSVIDSKNLSVTPYDPNVLNYTLKELEKAIVSSPLGLNPKVDGQRLIAVVPPLTKEHVQAICKIVAKSSEVVKQSIRRARQKALDTIKKAVSNIPKDKDKAKKKEKNEAPSFSKDEAKRLEKEIDELTKKFIKSAEDMCKAKEKEISQA
ncbi:hypothetical protein V2J09_010973 [Rumex salicifolius]